MEDKAMTDMNRINDEALNEVTGGKIRTIHNSDASYTNIRSAAGLNSKVLFRMNNGQKVDTTGNKIHRDGFDWYEIYLDNDQYGWIAGHLIGY